MSEWEFRNLPSGPKAAYILVVISFLLLLSWFSINQPQLAAQSVWYFNLGVFALVVFVIDFAWEHKTGDSFISTSFWEESPIFGKFSFRGYMMIFFLSLLFASFVFLQVAATQASIVGAPTALQVIDLGVTGNVIVTVASTLMENAVFFYFITPTLFGIVFHVTRNWPLAFVFAVFMNGILIFPFYHFLNYGLTDLTSTVSVAMFAIFNSSIILFIRNPIFTDMFHAANNLAVLFAKTTKVGFLIAGGG